MGYSLIAVVGFNIFFGVSKLIYELTHMLKIYVQKKMMIKNKKIIEKRLMKKYSSFTRDVILTSLRKKITVE